MEEFNHVLAVNVTGVWLYLKHAIPRMIESGGGCIINVSSIDGIAAGMNRNTPYGISKGALHMLTKTTASNHGREGIRANCIAPGHVQGAFPAAWLRDHKYWPPVGRADNVYGDRNLFCACVPMSEYAQD